MIDLQILIQNKYSFYKHIHLPSNLPTKVLVIVLSTHKHTLIIVLTFYSKLMACARLEKKMQIMHLQ